MNTQTLTTDNAGAVFYAELAEWADQLYLGAYAEGYADAVLYECRGYVRSAEADLLPFLSEAASVHDRFFSEFISSQIPVYTAQLVADWAAAGYPEPGYADGDIFEQMRAGLAEHIADKVSEAAAELSELLADFQARYADAEEREWAEADEAADELEATAELERRGYKSNYIGLYSVTVEVDGCCITNQFDTATAALDAVLDKEAAAAAD